MALNATVYHANIHTDYPLNTPVFRIRAIIRSIDDLLDLSISLSQTGEINDIFEFAGGSVDDRIGITQADLVQEGDQYVFDTVIVMVEDPVDVLGEITEPEELDIDVSLVGLFLPDQAVQEISQATGQIINAPGEGYPFKLLPSIIYVEVFLSIFLLGYPDQFLVCSLMSGVGKCLANI